MSSIEGGFSAPPGFKEVVDIGKTKFSDRFFTQQDLTIDTQSGITQLIVAQIQDLGDPPSISSIQNPSKLDPKSSKIFPIARALDAIAEQELHLQSTARESNE